MCKRRCLELCHCDISHRWDDLPPVASQVAFGVSSNVGRLRERRRLIAAGSRIRQPRPISMEPSHLETQRQGLSDFFSSFS